MKTLLSNLCQYLRGRTVVITGAGSGIGQGLAEHCAGYGMKLVLADIESEALSRVTQQLREHKVEVLDVNMDVSCPKAVSALAKETLRSFGVPTLVFSNAGISGPIGPIWEVPPAQFERTMQINLMGSVYLLQSFIPPMLEHEAKHSDALGYITLTSSHLGLVSEHSLASYVASKQGLVGLAESTQHDLKREGSAIHVSTFFPFFVQSNLPFSGRHFKGGLFLAPQSQPLLNTLTEETKNGITAQQAAEHVFQGLAKHARYIFTDEKTPKAFLESDRVNDLSRFNSHHK